MSINVTRLKEFNNTILLPDLAKIKRALSGIPNRKVDIVIETLVRKIPWCGGYTVLGISEVDIA